MTKATPKKPIRDIPAYQEYASDVLSKRNYRLMSLSERGLWDTMRKECWVNKSVPVDSQELAKYLGLDVEAVRSSLTERVKSFFSVDGNSFYSPELEAYRQMLVGRHIALSEGGRKGGLQTQNKNKNQGSPEASPKPLSKDELGKAEFNWGEVSNKEHQQWVYDYDKGDLPRN